MISGMIFRWRVSSLSFANGNCVEAAGNWRTASEAGNCAEVASDDGAVLVRDTKDRAGPVLTIAPAAWARFTRGIKKGTGG